VRVTTTRETARSTTALPLELALKKMQRSAVGFDFFGALDQKYLISVFSLLFFSPSAGG
jgi:hypothetical protein